MTPCPLCRTEIVDAQSRCPACGTRVKRDSAPVPPPAWAPATVASTIAPATMAPAPASAPAPPGGPAYYGAPVGAPATAPGTVLLAQTSPLPPAAVPTWAPPP